MVADEMAVFQDGRIGAGQSREGRHEREAQLVDELPVAVGWCPDDFAAQLDDPAVFEGCLQNTAPRSTTAFEQHHVGTSGGKVTRCAEPRKSSTDHHDIESQESTPSRRLA